MRLTGLTLKVLLPQLTSDPASAERLRREAVIAMRLKHPNACPRTRSARRAAGPVRRGRDARQQRADRAHGRHAAAGGAGSRAGVGGADDGRVEPAVAGNAQLLASWGQCEYGAGIEARGGGAGRGGTSGIGARDRWDAGGGRRGEARSVTGGWVTPARDG